MEEQATMFLNNLSVVDHGVIDTDGNVVGGSYNPSFLVGGKIDPVEQVVVDFSQIKKQLKNSIDDPVTGFDHKLWVVEHFSNCDVLIDGNHIVDFDKLDSDFYDRSKTVTLKTPFACIDLPKDAIKFIPTQGVRRSYSTDSAGVWFQQYLRQQFPNLQIQCRNTVDVHTYYPKEQYTPFYFTYAHGLKNSTSWGCQNIGHGHLSFVQIESQHKRADQVAQSIATDLNRTMFINKENLLKIRTNQFSVQYTSSNRGLFSAIFIDNVNQKCVVLDSETTIEHLVDYVCNKYTRELQSIQARSVFVSEGLSKGAWRELDF